MPRYPGHPVRIKASLTVESVALTPDEGASAHVRIFARDWSEVLAETDMTWSEPRARWEYVWETEGRDPGTYRARIRVEGVDGGSVWAYLRVKLDRDPAVA